MVVIQPYHLQRQISSSGDLSCRSAIRREREEEGREEGKGRGEMEGTEES